jgi:hypothetical protein
MMGVREGLADTPISCPTCRQKLRVPSSALPAPNLPAVVEDPEPEEIEELADDGDGDAKTSKAKKKKKKKKLDADLPSDTHIAMVVIGIVAVLAVTGIGFVVFRSAAAIDKYNEGEVLAELKQIGAFVERDHTSPDKPVIGINISGMEYRAALLNKLVVFPDLRKLDLSGTSTTDFFLQHMHGLTSLRVLRLGHTKVTRGGMGYLTPLVNLEDLDLTQALVTDDSLEELKVLTKLKKIHLDGTLASGIGLKAHIPGLEIIK